MRPESESELADAVRDVGGPLEVRGGGTRLPWRPVAGAVLETGGLAGVRLYEPGALTLVVGAGTPLAEVEAVLAAKGQRLAFEPMDARGLMGTTGEPTIGGAMAANVSGPRRVQAGAARDFLLGVRFVDGAGRAISNGGRVMKNVTGYDLVKLMAGSFGTLGVLSEVSLKVLAVPKAEATLVQSGLTAADGQAALAAALRSPFDVSGAAWVAGQARVRVEGLAGSVAYRAGRLRAGACAGWSLVEGEESAALWREVRDVAPFAGRAGAVWKVSVTPSRAAELLAAVEGTGAEAMLDWGGGLVWLLVPESVEACGAGAIRGQVAAQGGHATLVRAGERGAVAMFQPESAVQARLSQGLRQRFDPRGILNPGLTGPLPVPA